ncbi:hypothetical protein RBU60_03600 [Mesonia sp. MT50]|uniref:GOLD domain-containing protein n=1 Tax=Mesonia profundi TaxID=3070998 RepID=A0ABU1A0Y4_9FLAO|nr:hypothetical protein [Mesonia profundi]MDQ7916648.1 hypothetical protein [Mesonia profundi]
MKNFTLFLLLLVMFTSCSSDDINDIDFTYELMPVSLVDIPDTLTYGEDSFITLSYLRPSTCHAFAGFNLIENEHEIKLSILNTVIQNGSNCEDLENVTASEMFEFHVEREDYYIFKIYEGLDQEGNEVYLTKEVMIQL